MRGAALDAGGNQTDEEDDPHRASSIPAVLMRPTASLPLSSEGAPLVLRLRRYHLRPMCPGHAPNNGRHVEIQLSRVGVFLGHWPVVAMVLPQAING